MSPDSGSLSTSSESFRFPKLNGQNYALWCQHMQAALQAKFLWLYVTGVELAPDHPGPRPSITASITPDKGSKQPTESAASASVPEITVTSAEHPAKLKEWKAANKEWMDWSRNDQAAMGLMKNAAESSQWPHVASAKTSKEMWDIWRDLYVTSQQKVSVHYHFEDLYTRKWDEKVPMADHIATMLDLHQKITAAGEEFPEVHVARAIVLSLPRSSPTWEMVKQRCFSQTNLTLDFVTSELTANWVRVTKDSEAQQKEEAVKQEKLALLSRSSNPKSKKKKGPKPDDECRYCHGKGHWAPKCPKRLEDEKNKGKANLAVSELVNLGERSVGQLFMAIGGKGGMSRMLLDCGASDHMFCDFSLFSRFRSITGETISVGDRHEVPIAGRGSVTFKARLSGGFLTVTLNNVMYVPALAANLVSLGTLQRLGAEYKSVGDTMVVYVGGSEFLVGRMLGNAGTLYDIDVVESQSVSSAYVASRASLRLWHRRLGHLNLDQVRRLESSDLVDGISIDAPLEYDHLCEGCALGKSHRLPLPKASTTHLEKMELLVMDLTGPMSVPTWDGAYYALVIIEASTRFPIGRVLKRKEDVGEAVRDVVALMEKQSGLKVKRMRSDNGSEFVNNLMDAFTRRNGILHETTNPHLPQQNGISERAIAVLFDMVRCMLHSAGMDLRYWGEAFMYAVYLRSVSPTSGLDGMVPRHAWTGKKPDISHIRIFGSVGFANIPKKVRGGKLEATSVKVRLLGWWVDETKGYRLEDVETGKLVTSRDVRFVEDEKSSDLAIIETPARGSTPTEQEIDKFIEEAVALPDPPPESPPVPVPVPPAVVAAPEAEEPRPPSPPPPKRSRWADLPPRDHPTRERRQAAPYGGSASESDVAKATDGRSQKLFCVFLATAGDEPQSYHEAMASPDSKQWEKGIASETGQLERTGTFEWVHVIPDGRKAVGSRLVFKVKRDGNGRIVKYKVRIVAKGFEQVPGEDFAETFSSVAKFTTLRVLLSLAASLDWEIHQIDVVAAYLQGDLDEEIYMEVPEGVEGKGEKGRYWRLKKALYGLKQAGRQWKQRLDEVMRKLGFEKSSADDCLYLLFEDGKVVLVVLVYVDDMAVAGPKLARVVAFKEAMAKEFEITDLGELKYILGIQVSRDRTARTIALNQTAYIHQLLDRFGMKDANSVTTPLVVKHNLSTSQSPKTDEERESYLKYANGIKYLSLVGSILYAAQTRPDIQFPVGLVAQFGGNPGKAHLEAAKRILRYLKGTAHYHLVLGRRGEGAIDLVGWTDSNWAADPDSRRSIGGFVFEVAGSSISWASKKQPTVALSTVEAEYMAASNATKEAIWLRTLLESIGFSQVTATTIHADNQGCIALAHNPVAHSRAKHIDIRHHFIRERIQRGEVDLEYVSTKDMLADIFTKQLPLETFARFRTALGVIPGPSSSQGVGVTK